MSDAPNRRETAAGLILLGCSLLILPSALTAGNLLLGSPLSPGLLNLVFFAVNFIAAVWCFRRFLAKAARHALGQPARVIWFSLLAYGGYLLLTELVSRILLRLDPGFYNVNDTAIYSMLDTDFLPLAIGTVLLVPLAEETLYRGLIFHKLLHSSPVAAYIVSMAAFSAIHVVSYIGAYSPLRLFLCFLQYLPAGYCLCWCYRQSGTIFSPILTHTLVNAAAIYQAMR